MKTSLAAAALGLTLLLLSTAGPGCTESSRRDDGPSPLAPGGIPEGSAASATPAAPPDPDRISAADVTFVVDSVCATYRDWPQGAVDGDRATALARVLAALQPGQRARLEATDWLAAAAEHCPEVLGATALAGVPVAELGGLPRPAPSLLGVPGFYGPSEATSGGREALRYEWTALGLGCLSLRAGSDQDLREAEAAFLSAMGYDRDSYIAASLAMDDRAMSQRIFAGIRDCAQRMQRASTLRQPE